MYLIIIAYYLGTAGLDNALFNKTIDCDRNVGARRVVPLQSKKEYSSKTFHFFILQTHIEQVIHDVG